MRFSATQEKKNAKAKQCPKLSCGTFCKQFFMSSVLDTCDHDTFVDTNRILGAMPILSVKSNVIMA